MNSKKTSAKLTKAIASKKLSLKASTKGAITVSPRLAGNHNETLLLG